MHLLVDKHTLVLDEALLDTFSQQTVEFDMILPDYCPDVVKILMANLQPVVTSCQIIGQRLEVEVSNTVNLYYLTENGAVRCHSQKTSFGRSFEISGECARSMPEVTATVDYINPRAQSKRRVDIKAGVTVAVKVFGEKHEEIVGAATGMGIQLKKKNLQTTKQVCRQKQQFSVREELELGQRGAGIAGIVASHATAIITDHRVISGKVIIKGELLVHTIYQNDDEAQELEIIEHSVPISQIVDVDGITEDCQCSVNFTPAMLEVSPKQESDGQSHMLSLACSVEASVDAFKNVDITVASDAYSTEYHSDCVSKPVSVMNLLQIVADSLNIKEEMELPPGIGEKIVDIWSRPASHTISLTDTGLELSGRLVVCMLANDDRGMTEYFEKNLDYRYKKDIPGSKEGCMLVPHIDVLSTSFNYSGDASIELRCELKISGPICRTGKEMALVSITADESKPKPKNSGSALTIYYADPGETVWDIAKQFNTSWQAVINENNLQSEQLGGKTMLMIPML